MGKAREAIKRRASCIMASRGFCSEEVKPLHVFVQPDRQALERGVVRSPVGAPVAGLWLSGFTHAPKLPVRATGFVQQSYTLLLQRPRIHRFQQIKGKLKLFINIKIIPHLIHITQLTLTNHIQDLSKICMPRLELLIRIIKLSP